MVKTLHQIETISDSLSLDEQQRVRLARAVVETGNGHARERATIVVSPAEAAVAALAAPLDFPPLAAAVVPGDRVAIAVDAAVPQAAGIVRGVIDSLQQAGVDAEAISIVTTSGELGEQCRSQLGADVASRVQFVVHDPRDSENLCLLGATRHGALLVNRAIFDSDLVLPIGCARLGDYGAFDGLFPQFSDTETIERFRMPAGAITDKQRSALVRETNEAGARIGAPIVVRIVPGANDSVGAVLAGGPQAVAARSTELCQARWAMDADRRASLVIATVTGGPESQTWQNVARALVTAERLVEEGGAIAVCSNLARAPGRSLGRLLGANDLEKAEQKILSDHEEDSWPAWELARALRRGPVYFLSQLEDDIVEEMGLAPVADVAEIARLAGRHKSCIVVDNSQHVVATVRGE